MAFDVRMLRPDQIGEDFLEGFAHEQRWTRQWMREGDGWALRETDKLRTWNDEKRRWIAGYLKEQIARGGCAFGAYAGERLIGFASADGPVVRGSANLTMLFVDDREQRRGVGSALFEAVCDRCARRAQGLYISAIPSQETVAFYEAMGCANVPLMPEFMDSEDDRPMGRGL